MAALTAPLGIVEQEGNYVKIPVKASTVNYTGGMTASNGGYAEPAAGTSGKPFLGVAQETNTLSTSDGAQLRIKRTGRYEYPLAGATVADIDKLAYALDDNNLTLKPQGPPVGKIVKVETAGKAMIVIDQFTSMPTSGGLRCITVPFDKQTTEYDTGYDLPARSFLVKAIPEVKDNVAGSSLDVGTATAESGDPDGIIDGASCVNAGIIDPIDVNATEANLTVGVLLGTHIKSGDATPLYAAIPKWYNAGATAKSIVIKTSDHAVSGKVHLFITEV